MTSKAEMRRFLRPLLRANRRRETTAVPGSVPEKKSFDTLMALWRDVALFGAAFAYLAGWTYIRSYYREFEIDPTALDISLNNYFVYAFFAFLSGLGAALVIALLLFTAGVDRLGGGRVGHTAVLVAFAFAMFVLQLGLDVRKLTYDTTAA